MRAGRGALFAGLATIAGSVPLCARSMASRLEESGSLDHLARRPSIHSRVRSPGRETSAHIATWMPRSTLSSSSPTSRSQSRSVSDSRRRCPPLHPRSRAT